MCQNYSVFILVRDKWNNFCVSKFHFDEKLRCTYSIALADIGTTRVADPINDIANYYAGHTYMYFKALTVICRLAVLRSVMRSRNATKTGNADFASGCIARERIERAVVVENRERALKNKPTTVIWACLPTRVQQIFTPASRCIKYETFKSIQLMGD